LASKDRFLAKILTADLRYVPLSEIKVGQEVIAFEWKEKSQINKMFDMFK